MPIVLAIVGCLLLIGCRAIGTPAEQTGVARLSGGPKPSTKVATSKDVEPGVKRLTAMKPRKKSTSVSLASHKDETGFSTAPAFKIEGEEEDSSINDEESPAVISLSPTVAKRSSQKSPVPSTERSGGERETFIEILGFTRQQDSESSQQATHNDTVELPESTESQARSLRLRFPTELPGANAARIELPETDDQNPQRKLAAIDKLFPPPPSPRSLVVAKDRVLTLQELEVLALEHSPIIAQAAAQITMSQGVAIQQGIYPNPVIGYESDTVGSSFTRDYQGMYFSQLVKTGGKLKLQRAAANMDVMNAQLTYEKTRLDVLRSVRAGYYNVLVSQEANRINQALVLFTNQVYVIMIDRLKNGEQAAYELSQLQTLVIQARMNLMQSQNRYVAAWKQLAAAVGMLELQPAYLADRVDMSVPNLDFDDLLAKAFSIHPDLQASINLESQSRLNLQLQKTIPLPDVTVAGALQNDFTTPGYQRSSYNLNLSVPVPIFDRNQGNIRVAQGRLNMATQQYALVQNDLNSQLADAFERYQTARVQSEYYRTQVLPDLARAYRGVYESHIARSTKVAFGDIIVAQQNLASGISNYVSSLLAQWVALTDIANILQLQDFNELLTFIPASPRASDDIPALPSPKPPTPISGGQP